jgi:hypothetical protein
MLDSFFHWLQETSLAETMRASPVLFPWVESVHVLAIALVVGSIAAVDLRLLGLASRSRPITRLIGDILPLTWTAFAIAVMTGLTLFSSNAVEYARNGPMRLKMLFLAIAGINMLLFHLVTYRSVAAWDEALRAPLKVRLAGAASLALWVGIVAFGGGSGSPSAPDSTSYAIGIAPSSSKRASLRG